MKTEWDMQNHREGQRALSGSWNPQHKQKLHKLGTNTQ